jgi:hypothetical protein
MKQLEPLHLSAMTTPLLQPPPKLAKVINNLDWEQLEELDRSLEEFAGVKLVYLDGTAEIMPISEDHEDFKVIIRRLLEVYMEEVGMRFYGRGGPTLGSKHLKARNEPDESYNLESKKPYPDLVIEVTVTSGGVDKYGFGKMVRWQFTTLRMEPINGLIRVNCSRICRWMCFVATSCTTTNMRPCRSFVKSFVSREISHDYNLYF